MNAEVKNVIRSHAQNNQLWSLLTDLADQVPWPVNGSMVKMSPDDWKTVTSAALLKQHRMAEGIDGGFVILGAKTSRMSKAQLSDLLTLIVQFGDSRRVRWTLLPPLGD